jgi:phosphate transport system substrate-binding protein
MSVIRKAGIGVVVAGAIALIATSVSIAADISGAGATFPYPIYAKWADTYKNETGDGLNYQSIGSGGGIKQIQAKTVTFGASDKPLSPEELEKSGLVQFPMVMGGVVPVVNVEGIEPGSITLTGDLLARIYQGKISRWDDPAIRELNPGVPLPPQAIAVVHRSDGSGTTFIFTDYLARTSDDWKQNVGASTSVQWPVGIGAKGNEGVANNVKQTAGSVGYVEYAYAKQNNLAYAKLVNRAGKAVAPTTKTFQAAAANADWVNTPGFSVILNDEPGDESWPITSATFILMQKRTDKPEDSATALRFFDWAYRRGANEALALDYVPLPENVANLVRDSWKQITGPDGKPVYQVTN